MNKVNAFQKFVRKHFAFLAAYDFSAPEVRTEGEVCVLTYKSPRVSVMLCYGPPEFEAIMSFWLNAAPKMSLSVGDLHVVGQRPETWKPAPGTEGLESDVSFLASAVRSVEGGLCSGDPLFYELMWSARLASVAEWRQSEELRAMRAKAEAAWKAKKYGEVVEAYGAEVSHLTAVEKKRLEYAEKKVRSAKT
jgi:hypothetical protein